MFLRKLEGAFAFPRKEGEEVQYDRLKETTDKVLSEIIFEEFKQLEMFRRRMVWVMRIGLF